MSILLFPVSRGLHRWLPTSVLFRRSFYGVSRHAYGGRGGLCYGATEAPTSYINACDVDQSQPSLLGTRWGLCMKSIGARGLSTSAEVDEPTIHEGEVVGTNSTGEHPVMDYLQSRGIDIAALEEMEFELPKSVSIMKERIDYLQNVIGLTIKDINDYPLMIGCSVSKNLSPVVQYLQSLKVTKNSLPMVVRKYPQVLHSSVAIDLIPNVRYIQGLGVELKQVGSVLTRFPQVLGYRIEGTMSTSVAYLVMIGVDKRQIGPVLTEKPEIMGMRVSNNIRPKVEFIVSCGIPHLVVGKMIENRPYILDYDVDLKMRPAVDALLELGVRREALPQMLVQYPELLGMKIKDKVEAKLPWLTAKVGVRSENIAAILEKLPQILVINVPTATKRVHALRDLGLTKDEVARMIVVCPQLLGLSIEKRITPNGEFLVKEMERDIKELLEFPAFLTYDLELRIRPRFVKIKEKGVTCSLAWMTNCSDTKFENRLNEGYNPELKDEVDATFDTVGRLRVHEDVPSDDESEDKRRTSRQRGTDFTRAQSSISRSVMSPSKDDFNDRNRPPKQSYRSPSRGEVSRSTPAAVDTFRRPSMSSSNDVLEDKNRAAEWDSRQSLRVRTYRPRSIPTLDYSDDEFGDDSDDLSLTQNKRGPSYAETSKSRSMGYSTDDEFDYEKKLPGQSFEYLSDSEVYRPRPMVDSSDDESDDNQRFNERSKHPPRSQPPRSDNFTTTVFSIDEFEDGFATSMQSDDLNPPRTQTSTSKPVVGSSDYQAEDRSRPSTLIQRGPLRTQNSRPRPVSMMPDSSEDEFEEEYFRPSTPSHRGPPHTKTSRPRPMSMMPDSSDEELEDENRPFRQIYRHPPRPEVRRSRSLRDPMDREK